MKKQYRSVTGYLSMFVGLSLIVLAIYLSGEPKSSSAMRGAAVAASAVSGGVLTLVVSRRLLTTSES